MLNLIFGRSKSGKTTYIDTKVAELAKNGENRILVIVPDQVTFETEKAYLSLLGAKLSQKVLVLGFSRMCDYVFETTGYIRKTPADDQTKALLMSIALEEVRDSLNLYSEKALNPELSLLMLSARKELALSGNNQQSVFEATADADALTSAKLKDIYLASEAMDALLTKAFDDPDAELSIVADILRTRRIFDGYHIFIDSYLSFTAPELEAVSALMNQCAEMYVTLSYDGVSSEGVFRTSFETSSRLRRIAQSEGVGISEPVLCNYNGFFAFDDLAHLEQNVFMEDKCSFGEKSENITMYRAKDRYDEVDFVAREIRRLIIDYGYRYSDIAVVGRDLKPYSSIISTVFDKYEISYFADKPHDITSKPLVKLISSCFNCITGGFDKDDVLNLLKTGLTSASDEDVSVFENYIFTWQLNYSSLFSDFTSNPRGFADEFTFEDIENLNRAESVRKLVVSNLKSFKEKYAGKTAGDICKGLYELLIALGTDKKLLELADKLSQWEEVSFSAEQMRLWDIFINTLDKTSEVIGDRELTLKRFYDLFMLELSLTDISFIPKAVDQVTVGDIERLRLGGRKCVFVIGTVDSEFPKTNTSGGLFTASERNELSKLNILDEADDEQNADRELYLCYYALTSASHKLFVSFPASELSGEVKTPSVIISELDAIFPDCNHRLKVGENTSDLLWAKKPSYDIYASRARSKDPVTLALRDYYADDKDYAHRLLSLENVIYSSKKFNISDQHIAEKLFGKNLHLSASKIEKYHLCRFSYFCQYGLKAGERRKASIDALEYGSFVHYIMEKFFCSFTKPELLGLDDDKILSVVSSVCDEYANLHFGGLSSKSARFNYLFDGVKESSVTLVKHLIAELSQSEFTPVDFELDIGKDISAYRLELENGLSVTVTGKVDRADILNRDGKAYIRIVDYKTGTKIFNLSDVIYGLNLQMLLYLSVIKNKGQKRYGAEVIPAGVLYMPAFVPTLEMAADATSEQILAERNKKLKMNGILLNDEAVLSSMDKELKGMYIPVSMGAKGLKGTDNLATLEEFGAVFAHIDKLIGKMTTELLNGDIDASPAVYSYDACQYCPYSAVCIGRDESDTKAVYKLDRDEILKELGINREEEV